MNDFKKTNNERIPYQLPMPKEALSEIVVPDALAKNDDRMWVQQAKEVYFRPLCLNISQGYWMNLLKVTKSGVLSRHRHPNPVHGFVLKGHIGIISSTNGLPKKEAMFLSPPVKRTPW